MFAQDSRCSQNVGVLSSLKPWAKAHHTLSQAISQPLLSGSMTYRQVDMNVQPTGDYWNLGCQIIYLKRLLYSTLLYFALLYSTLLYSTFSLSLSLSISTYTHVCIIHIYIYKHSYIHIHIYVYMCVWCYDKSTYIYIYWFIPIFSAGLVTSGAGGTRSDFGLRGEASKMVG